MYQQDIRRPNTERVVSKGLLDFMYYSLHIDSRALVLGRMKECSRSSSEKKKQVISLLYLCLISGYNEKFRE